MADGTSVAARYAAALARRSLNAVLRQVTVLAGSVPAPNPPTISAPVIDGSQAAGATTLSLRTADAVGRIVAGDVISVGGASYTATGSVIADANGSFASIPVTPALAAPLSDATPVTIAWSADLTIAAKIESYPRRIVDGELTNLRDLQLLVAAFGLPGEILPTWRLVINGDERTIITAMPVYQMSTQVAWRVVAR